VIQVSGSDRSPLTNYRARLRWEINDLLSELASLDREPAVKESLRQHMVLLLKDVETARPGNRLLASKIRDFRAAIHKLRA
jgi:hypothetical protein